MNPTLKGLFCLWDNFCVISCMKRLWLIILLVSCTTAPKINYKGDVNDEGKYHGKGVLFNYYQFE